MKNLINSKILTLSLCVAILSSCEKEQIFVDDTSITNEEGFMSKTEQNDTFIEESSSAEAKKPLLHMSFGSDVSKEEAQTQFDQAVVSYMNNHLNQNKSGSDAWIYKVATYTGHQKYNNTDGRVTATVYFDTDTQNNVIDNVLLDNKGNDREGGWDIYAFSASIPGKAVKWVEVKSAEIRLRGTDGWFITAFNIEISPSIQTIDFSYGKSTIKSKPNIWLDNDKKEQWDSYDTGVIGSGRLNFRSVILE